MKPETLMKEETPKKKVTKEKSPGRVAAGKRLAEHNRLKKLEAKNKEHKEKIVEEEPREEVEKIEKIEKPAYNIGTKNISLLLLVVFAGGSFYFRDKIMQKWKSGANSEKSLEKTKEVKSEPVKPDPFYME